MRNLSAKVVLLLAVTIGAASCEKGFVYRVFNNTGEDLLVASYDTKMHALRYELPSGAFIDIAVPTKLELRTASGTLWSYENFPLIGKDYWYSRSQFGSFDIRFQVQPGGIVYVLAPGATSITNEFPPQPRGLPLHPTKSMQDKP